MHKVGNRIINFKTNSLIEKNNKTQNKQDGTKAQNFQNISL